MNNLLAQFYTTVITHLQGLKNNERGSQTLEWIGIAAVIVILVGVISTAFADGSSIGNTVREKFVSFIDQIGGS